MSIAKWKVKPFWMCGTIKNVGENKRAHKKVRHLHPTNRIQGLYGSFWD